jgi:ubiquinone/menaquinone biosynthesis C-methylase UbiE
MNNFPELNEQQKYYQDEWSRLKLSDKLGQRGWKTAVPAPDFVMFVQWLNENKITGKALDLGCGGGRHSVLLARNGFETYGIDFAEAAIKQATTNAYESGFAKSTYFRVGDVLDLPYERDYFDVVNDDGCLHHIEPADWSTYLENIKRVIKQGGILRVKAFSKNCRYYTENSSDGMQWVQLGKNGQNYFTYFFLKDDIRRLFANSFEIIKIAENAHTETESKRFFFVTLRAL